MLEKLKEIDAALLLFINGHNSVIADFIFFWISNKWVWIPFYIWLAWIVIRFDKSHVLLILLFIAAAITISDQLASSVIKQQVMRLRPTHDPLLSDKIHIINNYKGGMYGFVSSHAANVFALAAFISRLKIPVNFPLMKILWTWAVVVSFSRIYLGVHFPGDIIGGAVVGILSGLLAAGIYTLSVRKFSETNKTAG